MRKLVFILLISPLMALSAVPDSLVTTDTMAVRPLPATANKLAFKKVATYIPPALFIGYGFMSLENKTVQRIDGRVHTNMQTRNADFLPAWITICSMPLLLLQVLWSLAD